MNKPIRTYCYKCNNTTNQNILFTDAEIIISDFKLINEEGDQNQMQYAIIGKRWIVSKCNGCDGFNLQVITKDFGDVPPIDTFTYPKKIIRKVPDWISDLPIKYVELFLEVYSAVNYGLFTLALMGCRTIIETFIIEKIGDNGTFKDKLKKLAEDGFIANRNVEILHQAIDAGSAAAHRGYKPEIKIINDVLDIAEYLLKSTILERKGESLKNVIPKRNNKS